MRLKPQSHDPVFRNGSWTCTKCCKFWQNKPYREDCQGVPNYQIRKQRPAHLFTVRELEKKGLQPADIRKPEGYVHMVNAPYWVYLYDINKTTPCKDE